jgi:SGNH domain-containing protein
VAAARGVVLASFALAAVSWRWVEQPARGARGVWRGRVTLGLVAAAALVGLAALAVWRSGGLPIRFPPAVDRIASFESYDKSDEQRRLLRLPCMAADTDSRDYAAGPCLAAAPGRRSILLWGDSHAADIAQPMAELAARLDVTLLQATKSTCPPSPLTRHASACARFNGMALARLQRGDVAVAVISAHWLTVGQAVAAAQAARASGASVIVIGPAPNYVAPASGLLARAMLAGGDPSGLPRTLVRPASFALDTTIRARLAAMPGVTYLSLTDFLCPRQCAALTDGAPIIWDYGHFTLAGARLVTGGVIAGPLKAELDRVSPPPAR